MMVWIRQYGMYFAWVVSLVATGGSLYFSEIALFEPCKLCWFQRIFMYPLTVLLGIASYRDDRGIISYTLPLSVIGGSISLYHYLLQKVPAMKSFTPCTRGVPCTGDYINWFGFVTIPFLALTAFVLITWFLMAARKGATDEAVETVTERDA